VSTESEAQEAAEREARAEGGIVGESERASHDAPNDVPSSEPEPDTELGVRIPLEQLSDAALHAIVEEFVTRDGTEHTEGDRKVAQVMALLERGDAEVWFNERTRTCNILRVER
jgi:uncharacterized protein YheU (UPF0270 family)